MKLQGTLMVSEKILIFFSFCPFKLLNKNMKLPKILVKFCDTGKSIDKACCLQSFKSPVLSQAQTIHEIAHLIYL